MDGGDRRGGPGDRVPDGAPGGGATANRTERRDPGQRFRVGVPGGRTAAVAVVVLLVVVGAGVVAPVVGAAVPASGATLAAADGGGTPGTDDETVTLSGRLLEADGDPAANQTLVVFRESDGVLRDTRQVTLDGDGGFAIEVPADATYRLVYYQVTDADPSDDELAAGSGAGSGGTTTEAGEGPNASSTVSYPVDGSPDVYAVARIDPTGNVDVGPVRLPAAYPLSLRATTERGGVPTAEFDVTDVNPGPDVSGGLSGVGAFENGSVDLGGTGVVEVRGEVTVTVRPNATDTYPNATTREFDVTQPTSYEFEFDYNRAPEATVQASATSVTVGETVGFNALESEDPDGEIAAIRWDFDGDGTVDATGEFVSHVYARPGDYEATATLVDDRGRTDAATVTVNVSEGGLLGGPPDDPLRGGVDVPTDPDGDDRFEDVDGDGDFDVFDLLVFLDALDDSPVLSDHPGAFDFDDSGSVTFLDVLQLLAELPDPRS
jgi:hypothetical protein